MSGVYDYRSYASLFGYGSSVHERSGGICQYCMYGDGPVAAFDQWRQLTVEHIIGAKGGGYATEQGKDNPPQLPSIIADLYPELSLAQRKALIERIDSANTVTACHSCNSMTSRMPPPIMMEALLADARANTSGPDDAVIYASQRLAKIFDGKRLIVLANLDIIRKEYGDRIESALNAARQAGSTGATS